MTNSSSRSFPKGREIVNFVSVFQLTTVHQFAIIMLLHIGHRTVTGWSEFWMLQWSPEHTDCLVMIMTACHCTVSCSAQYPPDRAWTSPAKTGIHWTGSINQGEEEEAVCSCYPGQVIDVPGSPGVSVCAFQSVKNRWKIIVSNERQSNSKQMHNLTNLLHIKISSY